MQSLYGNLSEVLLHAEIDKFIIFYDAVVIVIIPEDVFDEIMDLCLCFMQDVY